MTEIKYTEVYERCFISRENTTKILLTFSNATLPCNHFVFLTNPNISFIMINKRIENDENPGLATLFLSLIYILYNMYVYKFHRRISVIFFKWNNGSIHSCN